MSATDNGEAAFAPVLEAMTVMRTGNREEKKAAHSYLEVFQKSDEAWQTVLNILQSGAPDDAKLFAATTLRGKITYDVATIPRESLAGLRSQLLSYLKIYSTGSRPIRTQLCVCLAILAVQMIEWKDVLPMILTELGSDPSSHAVMLEFLRVLPEEVTEGRKITLTEEQLNERTGELLTDNAPQVLQILTQYAQSSESAATSPHLLECISSWLREIPVADVVSSPLLDCVFAALDVESSFDSAVECLCTILRETSEVDEYMDSIQILLPKVLTLKPRIAKYAAEEDEEAFKGITRVFAEAGESWVVLIARNPANFGDLVEAILECAHRDWEKVAIGRTFHFWYQLKQYVTLEKYIQARVQCVDVYSKLVDILMKQLEFPTPDDPQSLDLFDGDREQEENFREFRHEMGDCLKDCCEVMGVTECLKKVLVAMQAWMASYGATATEAIVPHWQELEAPLFAMRAMGRMVDKEENIILPQLMPILVQIPAHQKLRFGAVMALGRYTEWTNNHPEFLEPQFQYVAKSFEADSKEIIRAAAMAMKFFCVDCKHHLSGQVVQLQSFYNSVLDSLPFDSQEELTEGVAQVIAVQKPDQIYRLLELYVDPMMERVKMFANNNTDRDSEKQLGDAIHLLGIFIQWVVPYVDQKQPNPCVAYWGKTLPVLHQILQSFPQSHMMAEKTCRAWRNMFLSYRTAMEPLLPQIAQEISTRFEQSKYGSYLWVTGTILREFSEDRDVSQETAHAIYEFFESQTRITLRIMASLDPRELPDIIEDFFRMMIDGLAYYPGRYTHSELFAPVMQAAIASLALEQRDPLTASLHYMRDVISYGTDNPATSGGRPSQAEVQAAVRHVLAGCGEDLVNAVMAGMMITFPRDVFPDGSGVLLGLIRAMPEQAVGWIASTISMLPPGTVTEAETAMLIQKIGAKLGEKDGERGIRVLLQDFTNSYRRRYIAPRGGLGRLEATRFKFQG